MSNDDFVISVHALERFQERFPTLYESDDETGLFIYEEAMDAIAAGRISSIAPLELADYDMEKWSARNSKIVWTPAKVRGYVLIEGDDGTTVATVLVGKSQAEKRSRLHRKVR